MKKLFLFVIAFFLFFTLFTTTLFAATTWTEVQPAGNTTHKWNALTISNDGQTILSGAFDGRLYISTNGGTSWSETQPAGNTNGSWQGIVMTPDAQHMMVGNYGGRLYLSSTQGTSWTETQPAGNTSQNWIAVGMSDDGQTLLAASHQQRIYLSTNGGTSWAETQPAGNADAFWYAVSVSGDGQTLYAGINSGRLYRSINGGTSWAETQPAGNTNRPWRSISSSYDGQVTFAAIDDGTSLYRTVDRGANWSVVTPSGAVNPFLTAVSVSSNGQAVFAAGANGKSYLSTDTGTSWTVDPFSTTTEFGWNTGVMSRNGVHLYVGEWIGRLYHGIYFIPTSSSSAFGPTSPATAPGCNDAVPQGAVDLFQINRDRSAATLYFTPVQNTDHYHVVYGYQVGDERFGALSQQTGGNTGVQSLSIQGLDPRASYWFKVVPVNGCATGSWSNWLSVSNSSMKNQFYKYQ